jgi:hypothetical protein
MANANKLSITHANTKNEVIEAFRVFDGAGEYEGMFDENIWKRFFMESRTLNSPLSHFLVFLTFHRKWDHHRQ